MVSLMYGPNEVDLMSNSMGPIEADVNADVANPPSPKRIPGKGYQAEVLPYHAIHENFNASHLDSEAFLKDTSTQ